MKYVITCGDEGVQLNEGTRLGILGAGLNVEHVSEVFKALKKLFGDDIYVAANEEDHWIKESFNLDTFEQANATMQQHLEALSDKEGLTYIGILPFADPKDMGHGIKGHMVRPAGMHLANKVAFTLRGGEQTFHLGHFLVSAEWIHLVDEKIAKAVIDQQVEYYKKLVGEDMPLQFVFETEGDLDEAIVEKNKALLTKWGYAPQE